MRWKMDETPSLRPASFGQLSPQIARVENLTKKVLASLPEAKPQDLPDQPLWV
jgi:hypothetical protein